MTADLLRRLIEAGTPAGLVAEVALELAKAEAERGALDARRAADRERQQRNRASRAVTSCHVTTRDNADAAPLNGPPNESNLTPPYNPPEHTGERAGAGADPEGEGAPASQPSAKPKADNGQGTRLPAGWEPAPLPAGLAETVDAWAPGRLERELSKFRDHWTGKAGKDARKANWDAAWRNWLRNAEGRNERFGQGYGNGSGNGRRGAGGNAFLRGALDELGSL